MWKSDWFVTQYQQGKGKGKIVPVLSLNWTPHHEGVLGMWRYSSTHSLVSALDGGEWCASRPGRFTPRERVPGIHWIGSWMSSRAGLDAVPYQIRYQSLQRLIRWRYINYKSYLSWMILVVTTGYWIATPRKASWRNPSRKCVTCQT